jgi:hypothetical protein
MGAELIESRIAAGRWTGLVQTVANPAPDFAVTCEGRVLPGLVVTQVSAGVLRLELPLPADVVVDGLQVFLVGLAGAGAPLGRFVLFAGQPAEGDMMAEIALLRAELDLLKAAFRRHCRETGV